MFFLCSLISESSFTHIAGGLCWLLAQGFNFCSHGLLYVVSLFALVWTSLKHGSWVPRMKSEHGDKARARAREREQNRERKKRQRWRDRERQRETESR